ncbi:MAG: sigma factor-like helix-turn-helix DNA-binding protein [Gemmatimonadota bacterium]
MKKRTYEERIGDAVDALYDGALLLTGSRERAEALVLDVVVEGARAYQGGVRPTNMEKWIVARLFRQAIEYERENGGPDDATVAVEAADAVLPDLTGQDPSRLDRIFRAALLELPLLRRAAVWLVGAMGFSYAEGAGALGIERGEFQALLYRARSEMQARLAVALRDGDAGETNRLNDGSGSE